MHPCSRWNILNQGVAAGEISMVRHAAAVRFDRDAEFLRLACTRQAGQATRVRRATKPHADVRNQTPNEFSTPSNSTLTLRSRILHSDMVHLLDLNGMETMLHFQFAIEAVDLFGRLPI